MGKSRKLIFLIKKLALIMGLPFGARTNPISGLASSPQYSRCLQLCVSVSITLQASNLTNVIVCQNYGRRKSSFSGFVKHERHQIDGSAPTADKSFVPL